MSTLVIHSDLSLSPAYDVAFCCCCRRLRSRSAFSSSNCLRSTRSKKSCFSKYPSFVACSSSSSMPSTALNLSQSSDVFSMVVTVFGASSAANTWSTPVAFVAVAAAPVARAVRVTLWTNGTRVSDYASGKLVSRYRTHL